MKLWTILILMAWLLPLDVKAATIVGFIPKEGEVGEKVYISGTGFTCPSPPNAVSFNGASAPVVTCAATLLEVTVPQRAKTGNITVQGTISTGSYTVTRIKGMVPENGLPGDTITIVGHDFDNLQENNNVTFTTNRKAKIIAGDANVLVVEVPQHAVTGPVTVSSLSRGDSTSKKNFRIDGPLISSFYPARGTRGSTVFINGNGFDPTSTNNIVSFGNSAKVSASKGAATSLEVTVPDAAHTGPIKVINAKGESAASDTFTVEGTNPAWRWNARVGGQSSTFTNGSVNEDRSLFSNNFLFFDLSLTIPKLLGEKWDANIVARFGRQNVEGKVQADSQTIDAAVKDAQTVEGYGSLIWKPLGDKQTTFFIKPMTFGFIYDEDEVLHDQDVLREYTSSLGWMLADNSYMSGSLVEIGGGYSERFEKRYRVRCNVEMKYSTESPFDPFIAFKYNFGVGADDLVVYYGVSFEPTILFTGLKQLFTAEKKQDLTVDPM